MSQKVIGNGLNGANTDIGQNSTIRSEANWMAQNIKNILRDINNILFDFIATGYWKKSPHVLYFL